MSTCPSSPNVKTPSPDFRREIAISWRSITRPECIPSAKAVVRRFDLVCRGACDYWAGAGMNRNDLLFWLSLIWLATLCGAVAWAFVAL